MNETNVAPLTHDNRPASPQTSSEEIGVASQLGAPQLVIEATPSTGTPDGQESYERGTTLKNVGLFRQAVEHFEKAAEDPAYALKGFAQMGVSLKQSGKYEEAAVAFRRALQVPSASSKEQAQILYLLGRTLESIGRVHEALESYRWLPRLDVPQLDCPFRTPPHEPLGDEFRAIVEANRLGLAPPSHDLLQHTHHPFRREGGIHFDGQALPHPFVQNIQRPEPTSAVHGVAQKIHGPHRSRL